jgi:hypothetical protein
MRQHTASSRAFGLALLGIVLATFAACGGSGGSPTYDAGAGQVVAQVFPRPGFVAVGVNAVPTWTLYGDGTVIYRGGPIGASSSQLMTGRLTQSEVNRLLDEVVNQDHFFASTKPSYGQFMPDAGSILLTVNADGQSKSVSLLGQRGPGADQQTQNVFAVETALLAEHPAIATAYVAPGAALLVTARRSASDIATDGLAPVQWPYGDIDLAQAYSVSCAVSQQSAGCPSSGSSAKFFGVYGSRAHDVLTLVNGSTIQAQQGQYVYSVLAFPLLPDALVQQNGQARGVLVNGTQRVVLQPAPPGNG